MRFWVVCILCLLLLISVTSARKNKKKLKRLGKCMRPCNRHLDQVCASDGQTYGNRCLFKIAKCEAKKRKATLKVVAVGRCPGSVNSRAKITKKKNKKKSKVVSKHRQTPLCGNDGKTYRSRRQFRIAKRRSGGSLKLKYKGECTTAVKKLKPKRKRLCKRLRGKCQSQGPVCGSDGVTYKNCCAFLAEKKKQKRSRKGKLRVVACPMKTTALPMNKTTAKSVAKTTAKPQ